MGLVQECRIKHKIRAFHVYSVPRQWPWRYDWRMTHRFLVLSLVVALTGCAARTPPPAAASAAAAPQATRPLTFNSWVERSVEYPALVRQVYRQATAAVERMAAGKTRGSWAVILDADETVISNLTFQLELERTGRAYTPILWNDWTKRREATPLPGAKGFLDRVRALGGRIAIVTNRIELECPDTRAVFDAHALVYDVMMCRPNTAPSDKNPRFAAVAAGAWQSPPAPIEVVAWLGDNILDFPGQSQALRQQPDSAFADFGARFFVLPNPMYGSWQ